MSKNKVENVKLHGWQADIITAIDNHQSVRESDQYQGIADYKINRSLGINVAMPKGAGHTFLANYIASKYPTMLVYGNMQHYNNVIGRFALHGQTETVSKYEIFYAIRKSDIQMPSAESMQLRDRFQSKQVIVVDNALSVTDEIKDYIYGVSAGCVVMLGH